ncbi:MAG: glycosyltransferase family 2 protein [Selenomonadales bacterium]|nr:glycosyltransferase family 2 protein [Selenomonadales bacterium]
MSVSVIVPVYNAERFLPKAIESVLSQTYTDWELILVDDGSTDGSLGICETYANRDRRIKVFSQENHGVSSARNLGLGYARGAYVTFMDSDDELDAGAFEACAERVGKTGADMVVFSIDFIASNGAKEVRLPALEDKEYTVDSFLRTYIQKKVMYVYSNANKWYKRSLLDTHGIRFDEAVRFGEDRLFNYEVLRVADRISTLSPRFYRYYLRNNGSLSSRYIENFAEIAMGLHRAKVAMLEPYFKSAEERRRFVEWDAKTEFFNTLAHLCGAWPRLSVAERRAFCQKLSTTEYPTYFWHGRLRSGSLRIMRRVVGWQNVDILYAAVACYRRLKY